MRFALCLFLMAVSFAEAAELRLLRGRYEFARFEIGKQQRLATNSLNTKYEQELLELRLRLRQQGDLDFVNLVNEELKRFRATKGVGEDYGISEVKAMSEVSEAYQKGLDAIILGASRKQLELAHQYYETLSREEERLVRASKVDEVKAVRAEKEALVNNRSLATAKDLLARRGDLQQEDSIQSIHTTPVGSVVGVPELPSSLRSGLVLHLSFNEDDPRSMQDASGGGAHVAVRGAKVESEGRIGRALKLGGGGDRVEVTHQDRFTLPGEVTVALWVKLDKWDNGGGLCSKGTGGGNESLLIDIASDQYRFIRWNAERTRFIPATSPVRPKVGVWQHIAGVSDGKRMRIYVDGEVALGSSIQEAVLVNAANLTFGSRTGNKGESDHRSLIGLIDEVMVYDRALSGEEIGALMRYGDN